MLKRIPLIIVAALALTPGAALAGCGAATTTRTVTTTQPATTPTPTTAPIPTGYYRTTFPAMAPDQSAAGDAATLQQDILNNGGGGYEEVSCAPDPSVVIPEYWGVGCTGLGAGGVTIAAYVVDIQSGLIAARLVSETP